MNAILVSITNAIVARRNRLPAPAPLPEVERACAHSWAEGWWQGLAAGGVIGFSLATIIGLVS